MVQMPPASPAFSLAIAAKGILRLTPAFIAACMAILSTLVTYKMAVGRWGGSLWLEEPTIMIFEIMMTAGPFLIIACIPGFGTGSPARQRRYQVALCVALMLTGLNEAGWILHSFYCPNECFDGAPGYLLLTFMLIFPFICLLLMIVIIKAPGNRPPSTA